MSPPLVLVDVVGLVKEGPHRCRVGGLDEGSSARNWVALQPSDACTHSTGGGSS